MMKEVFFRLFLNIKDDHRAQIASKRVVQQLGNGRILKGNRYWKDPNLYEVEATFPIDLDNPAEQVLRALAMASRLANVWTVSVSDKVSDGHISGICSERFKFDELAWASFELQDENAET